MTRKAKRSQSVSPKALFMTVLSRVKEKCKQVKLFKMVHPQFNRFCDSSRGCNLIQLIPSWFCLFDLIKSQSTIFSFFLRLVLVEPVLSRDYRGFIKRREAGIFPFYSGMFPLLLLKKMYRVYRQILSNHPPTLP